MNKSIVCFGEALWDVLPTGRVIGGAPLNVAIKSSEFGLKAFLVSAVGNDELGAELISYLKDQELSTAYIQVSEDLDTSTVQVMLDDSGGATYEIVEPVAWDRIEPSSELNTLVRESDALVFGTLACRSESNYLVLKQLLKLAKMKVFDINLRPPFFDRKQIDFLLREADIVKMNDDELFTICSWIADIKMDIENAMSKVSKHYGISALVVTVGKDGALCLDGDDLYRQSGFEIEVKDTVGSGDAFLGALISKRLQGSSWQKTLEFCGATGALMATYSGGTAKITTKKVENFIKGY